MKSTKEKTVNEIIEEVTSSPSSRLVKAKGKIGVPGGALGLNELSMLSPLAMLRVQIYETQTGIFENTLRSVAHDEYWAKSVIVSDGLLPSNSVRSPALSKY